MFDDRRKLGLVTRRYRVRYLEPEEPPEPGSDRDKIGSQARAIALWATPSGERTASQITGVRAVLLEPMLASTSEADRKTIAALLETALAELTDSRDRARSICRFCAEGGACRPLGCPVEQAALPTES